MQQYSVPIVLANPQNQATVLGNHPGLQLLATQDIEWFEFVCRDDMDWSIADLFMQLVIFEEERHT